MKFAMTCVAVAIISFALFIVADYFNIDTDLMLLIIIVIIIAVGLGTTRERR